MEDEQLQTNCYVHCKQVWLDRWDCACNDECPKCKGEIEPFASIDDEGEIELHVRKDFVPEDGWPEGINTLQELLNHVNDIED